MVDYTMQPIRVQPLDIGHTLGTIAQLEGVQQRNRLLDLQTQEATRKVEDRNRLRAALPGATQGDAAAQAEVASIDPDLWAKIDKNQKDTLTRNIDMTGRLLYQVEQAPEQERPAAYAQARQIAQQNGMDVSKVPETYNPAWTRAALAQATSIADQIKQAEGSIRGAANQIVRVRGDKVDVLHTAPEKPDNQLEEVYDPTSPTGTRLMPRGQAAGQPGKSPGGFSIETDPATGRVTRISQGRGAAQNGAAVATPTVNKIEEKQLDASAAIARLDTIGQAFKPEYLQLGPRLGQKVAAMKDFVGADMSPDQQKSLSDFTEFRRATTTNLNQTIKDLTGSAMGVQEADRIISTMPNAGTGVFDGDSPTQFKAKMDGASRDIKNSLIRYTWAKQKGLDPLKSGIELKDVPALVNKRGDEIETEVRAQFPGATPEQIRMERNARVATEFGLAR